jgi:hypothetical protein
MGLASEWTGPRYIGGYGIFGRLTDHEDEFVWGNRISRFMTGEPPPDDQVVEVAPGVFHFEVNVQAASDAIVNGHIQYLGVTATCSHDLTVAAGQVVALTVTLSASDSCSIESGS